MPKKFPRPGGRPTRKDYSLLVAELREKQAQKIAAEQVAEDESSQQPKPEKKEKMAKA